MSTILLNQVHFSYDAPAAEIFDGLDLLIDTRWKAALAGRNGRGKTTLLKLIDGQLTAQAGTLSCPVATHYFPYLPVDPQRSAWQVARNAVADFAAMEQRMEALLESDQPEALRSYGQILARYESLGGYRVDALLETELDRLAVTPAERNRPFQSLSGGEQTRVLIAGLFTSPGFPLIDEPTNHLDLAGRELLADYLHAKPGFLLVSHDRSFLDRAVDHVVSINRQDVTVHATGYSVWREIATRELAREQAESAKLKREIRKLGKAAQQRRKGALQRETDKAAHTDKGYIGHQAAKQMKRALVIERRIEHRIAERRTLLGNEEKIRSLKLQTTSRGGRALLVANNVTIDHGQGALFSALTFSLESNQQLAVLGANGCGKSSLLDAICGDRSALRGTLKIPANLRIARGRQHPEWVRGELRAHLVAAGLDETRFRQILGVLGVSGDALDRPLESLSAGQLKKIDLARALQIPADLIVLDEPLNYVDVESREQIEALLLEQRPSLIFVEHDQTFVTHLASGAIVLSADQD